MSDNKKSAKRPMVGWYDPGQLMNTGLQVLASDLIGTRFDARREEALAAEKNEPPIDYTAADGSDFWFDFMADTGDGWDSTFHMASLVSQPILEVKGKSLPRGKFLLLGGDEIYPTASKQEYLDRLVAPFEAASPIVDENKQAEWDLFTAIHTEEKDWQLGHKTEPQLFRFKTPTELVAVGRRYSTRERS